MPLSSATEKPEHQMLTSTSKRQTAKLLEIKAQFLGNRAKTQNFSNFKAAS